MRPRTVALVAVAAVLAAGGYWIVSTINADNEAIRYCNTASGAQRAACQELLKSVKRRDNAWTDFWETIRGK
jgi:hypothetical protein